MRFVLFDDDEMFRSIAEEELRRAGHEIVGIADSALSCVGLIESSKPDGLLVDLSAGIHTDFDVVQAANDVGTHVIVFSFLVDHTMLDGYEPRPIVVPKPDVAELEQAILRVEVCAEGRTMPLNVAVILRGEAAGPEPTGITDAQAFFEALNSAVEGDTLVSIEPPDGADVNEVASRLAMMIRHTDRLLTSGAAIKLLLPAGAADTTPSLLDRLEHGVHVPHGTHVRTVIVLPAESGGDAFERLKQAADEHQL